MAGILYAPSGRQITRIVERSWSNSYVSFDDAGCIEDTNSDYFVESETYAPDGYAVLVDDFGDEWLGSCCRRLVAPDELGQDTPDAVEAWPDSIIEACVRLRLLTEARGHWVELCGSLPKDFLDDHRAKVIDIFLLGPLAEERRRLEAEIATFRATPEGQKLEDFADIIKELSTPE